MKKGELLSIAIGIAVKAHTGQFDKGGNPYILHPLKVMHYTKSSDEEIMAIAVLHDTVEDCKDVTWESLRDAGMTPRVVEGIRCLTKIPGETYEEYKTKVKSNKDSISVKKADLRHNTDIRRLKNKVVTEKDLDRISKYHKFYLELELAEIKD